MKILCLNRIFHSVIRGNDGELRLGVRRAAQFKSGSPVSAHPSGNMNLATLTIIANSVSTRKVFHIYYNPRYASCSRVMFYANFCICKSLCWIYTNCEYHQSYLETVTAESGKHIVFLLNAVKCGTRYNFKTRLLLCSCFKKCLNSKRYIN